MTHATSNETIIFQEEQSNLPLMITIYLVMVILGVSGLVAKGADADEAWPIIIILVLFSQLSSGPFRVCVL
jgi:hypothetical protein